MTQVITKEDAESPEAAQAAAEAAFAAVDGEEGKSPVKAESKPKEEAREEAPAKTDTVADEEAARVAAADAEWEGVPAKVRQTLETVLGKVDALDSIAQRLKSVEGRTGAALEGVHALKTALDTAKAVTKAGGEAPTQEQIAAAATNDAEWEKLKEDFPDWAEGTDKRIDRRIEERLSKLNLPPAVDVAGIKTDLTGTLQEIVTRATSEAKAEARELAKIDRKHEDWENVISSKEFTDWSFSGGPTAQEQAQYFALREQNPAQAEVYYAGFAQKHPQWWGEKGAMRASDKASDAIKLLDSYAEHRKAVADATAKAERNKKRLESAITPKGVTSPGTRSLSDEEAMRLAFESVDKE